MENAVDIKQMLGMTVGQIMKLERAQMEIQDVIDVQKESVASVIENNEIKEQWAQDILDELNL